MQYSFQLFDGSLCIKIHIELLPNTPSVHKYKMICPKIQNFWNQERYIILRKNFDVQIDDIPGNYAEAEFSPRRHSRQKEAAKQDTNHSSLKY